MFSKYTDHLVPWELGRLLRAVYHGGLELRSGICPPLGAVVSWVLALSWSALEGQAGSEAMSPHLLVNLSFPVGYQLLCWDIWVSMKTNVQICEVLPIGF